MTTLNFIIILIIIFACVKLFAFEPEEYINYQDAEYQKKFRNSKVISKLINNNLIKNPINKKKKILFITYDNRIKINYLKIHNDNLHEYAEKWGYEYKFYNVCNQNVYWCKIYIVLDALKSDNYDYVIWLDSDTYIKNLNIDIGNILNSYSSDIFVGSDNNSQYDITNAGVFIIKNSEIGKQYLEDCISYVPDTCFNKDGSLKGTWAGTCYEQGVMNILIADYYYPHTTILPNEIIFNYNVCSDSVFIMHMYASSDKQRTSCFMKKSKPIEYLHK